MTSKAPATEAEQPGHGPEFETVYSLEIFAELAGVNTQTVLHYQELSLVTPIAQSEAKGMVFDSESLRRLRRIEHLRAAHDVNDAALKLIVRLVDEVDRLRQSLRDMTR